MKYIQLFVNLLTFLFTINIYATHIVGGEFQLTHLQDDDYELSLVQYFDAVNGNPLAEDQNIIAYIFSHRDNQLMNSISLSKRSKSLVNYTNINCSIGSLRTREIIYKGNISLSPSMFGDPLGYYIIWERCCRNRTINNIENPDETGQTFYLSIPPVVKNNEPFINSTPQLKTPTSDYACVGQPIHFDFAGHDPDGDSLVYSLVTPFNSSTFEPLPVPSPSPHPVVNWVEGFDDKNMIPGAPNLTVNEDGLLNATPTMSGLFVFTVLCEEFRKGQKIGAVRRDFQVMVIEDCGAGFSPSIMARKPDGKLYQEGEIIELPAELGMQCMELLVFDQDELELVTLEAHPVNFNQNMAPFLPWNTAFITNQDTISANFCFPTCTFTGEEPFIVDFVIKDDACSQPLTDTLRVQFIQDAPNNAVPEISVFTDSPITIYPDQDIQFVLKATDADGDFVWLDMKGQNFELANHIISFHKNEAAGVSFGTFFWNFDCSKLSLDQVDTFSIVFEARSNSFCNTTDLATSQMDIIVLPRPNVAPYILIDQQANFYHETSLNDGSLRLYVEGMDDDLDSIHISIQSQNELTNPMYFTEKWGRGEVGSYLHWDPSCVDLQGKPEGVFIFEITLEERYCGHIIQHHQTLEILVKDNVAEEMTSAPNVFTPNHDGVNDHFYIPQLPANNCLSKFERVEILNRHGKHVFMSQDIDFAWDGTQNGTRLPPGVYFYWVKYNTFEIKGSVTLLY